MLAKTCPPGYYCPRGSTRSIDNPCPKGHYCQTTTAVPIPCPKGTYNSALYGSFDYNCIACTVTKYCAVQGLIAPTGTCAAGYICVEGSTEVRPLSGLC
jgi:hypothetical protein